MLKSLVPLLLAAGGATAQDYMSFQSPSGNIHCMIWADGADRFARCDMQEATMEFERPADCEGDFGPYFVVQDRGNGFPTCVTDTVIDPSAPVLPYGERVTVGGFTCRSERTGVTCTNGEGRGFSLARAYQEIF